ncbi:MAG: heme ABC transporter ATP-binding protein [Rhodospirillaceae bacterium]|nr:heme ABC transporter ATP-binding protein [Rhodospirillaceae bacterium]
MMRLTDLALDRRGRRIVEGVSLDIVPGRLLAIVGPNGAGKSTLLAAMANDLKPAKGAVRLDDKDLQRWAPLDLARRRAVMPQAARLGFSLPVRDVVALGRSPFWQSHTRAENATAVARALHAGDVAHLALRPYETLSGGEQQRVQLARAMAQLDLEDDAARPILLLDEPTANLDLAHQHAVLRLAHELTHRGVAVVAILHDLGLAFAYGDLVLVMHEGRAVAHGRPQDVLTPDLMRRVFMVEGTIISGHLVVRGPLAA